MNAGKQHAARHLYEFGVFRLDPAERIFARDGERIPLAPKAFDTLVLLVTNSGRVMTKEQLIQMLWPDSFVEENNLTQHISALRRALGPKPGEYIETVPKLGYRFVCRVRETAGDDAIPFPFGDAKVVVTRRTRTHIMLREEIEEEDDGVEPAEPSPYAAVGQVVVSTDLKRTRPWHLGPTLSWKLTAALATLAAVCVALLGLAIYRFRTPVKTPAVSTGMRSLAVLPFRNLKPDAETDFLSLALTDVIIHRLGYVREINVEPLSSVAKYRNSDLDARQIARELNVQNVVTGSYLKDRDDLRVNIEVIGMDSNAGPRREDLELKYDKLFRIQDWVAVSAIHAMGLELQPQEAERLNRDVPTDPAAYEYFLRGTDEGFRSDFKEAMQSLEKSVALEPGNAMAWAELATTYIGYANVQGGDPAFVEKGWQAFRRAIELDSDNRFIVDMMALHMIENNQAEQAIPLLQESIRRNPTDSFAHWYLSEAYRFGGELNQSVSEGELALRLNPNVSENLTFNTYLYLGQYRIFLYSLRPDDNSARTVFYRGMAYYYLHDARSAEAEFDRAHEMNAALLHSQIGQALAFALRHDDAQGLRIMGNIERSGGDDGEMTYKMAQAYAQLGDPQDSLRMLRRSIDLGFYPYDYFASDPLLAPLRGYGDYAAVMELARERHEAFRKALR